MTNTTTHSYSLSGGQQDVIRHTTVIGGVTDYSPLYRLINLPFFSFSIVSYNNSYIPIDNSKVIEIMHRNIRDDNITLNIRLEIEYKGERLRLETKKPLQYLCDNQYGLEDYLFHVMLTMKVQMKQTMFNSSDFKETADIMYSRLMDNVQSGNMNPQLHTDLTNMLNQIDLNANNELEGYFMTKDTVRNGPLDMSDTTETLHQIKEKLDEQTIQTEAEEYEKLEKYIDEGVNTLRLNRQTIKKLPKSKSNKFVLPLEIGKDGDSDKFYHLIKQPFSFLTYNNALFSVNINTGIDGMWDDFNDSNVWDSLSKERQQELKSVETRIASKKQKINDRRKRLNKANNKLDDQIDYLKEQFEKKADKFKHSSYVTFIAARTTNNINTIREAQSYSKRVEKALKNKRLTSNPIAFFDRALTLFLGETGEDIIQDLETLGYTSKSDAELGIKYLFFLLKLVGRRDDELISPLITITDLETFGVGYEKPEMIKVMAGHLFIHTVTISKEYDYEEEIIIENTTETEIDVEDVEVPMPPPLRTIQEYIKDNPELKSHGGKVVYLMDKGYSKKEIEETVESYPELFI